MYGNNVLKITDEDQALLREAIKTRQRGIEMVTSSRANLKHTHNSS
jgi:hypothetical protein